SVVINVGERGGHADSIFQADSCFSRDVLKLAVAKVAPELISSKLVDEINVEQTVAIHVGHRHSGAMIVMNGLVIFPRVIDGAIFKADAALLVLIGELKVVKDLPGSGSFKLLLPCFLQKPQRSRVWLVRPKSFR